MRMVVRVVTIGLVILLPLASGSPAVALTEDGGDPQVKHYLVTGGEPFADCDLPVGIDHVCFPLDGPSAGTPFTVEFEDLTGATLSGYVDIAYPDGLHALYLMCGSAQSTFTMDGATHLLVHIRDEHYTWCPDSAGGTFGEVTLTLGA